MSRIIGLQLPSSSPCKLTEPCYSHREMPSYPVCDRPPVSALYTSHPRARTITHQTVFRAPLSILVMSTQSRSHTTLPEIAVSSIISVLHHSDNHNTRKFVVQTVPILHAMPNSIHLPHHNTILPVRGHNGRWVARETRSTHSLRSLGDSSCPSPCNRCPFQPSSAFRPWVLFLLGLVLMPRRLLGVLPLVRPSLSWKDSLGTDYH